MAYVVPSKVHPGRSAAIYATYDPVRGWMKSKCDDWSIFTTSNLSVLTQDGLVVFLYHDDSGFFPDAQQILFDIYDPYRGVWVEGSSPSGPSEHCFYVNNVNSLYIDKATLYFKSTTTDIFGHTSTIPYVVGYEPNYDMTFLRQWSYISATKILAYFTAQPTTGEVPLWVSFTDMSIGADKWKWEFDDGATDTNPSAYHKYDVAGYYWAVQKIWGLGTLASNRLISAGVPGPFMWVNAYSAMANEEDLTLLRQYRDKVLSKDPRGKVYKEQLYDNSDAALTVLMDNPELLQRGGQLIQTNMGAVIQVLQGHEGIVYDPEEVHAYLQRVGEKAPPQLKALINVVQKEMRQSQQEGKPFLGFRFTKKD